MQPQEPSQVPPQQPGIHPDYSFIMSPEPQKKPLSVSGLGGNSLLMRVALVAGGFTVFLIIFAVTASLFSGSKGYVVPFTTVIAEQQELLHIVSTATSSTNSQANLSASNTNTATTIQLAIGSSQSQLLAYLKTNAKKVTTVQLNSKVSATTDQALANAITAGTYDSTFDSVIASQLNSYMLSLKAAYAKAPGAKGRAMLKSDYDQAQLLLTQVSSTN